MKRIGLPGKAMLAGMCLAARANPALPREPAEAGTDQGPGHVRAAVSGRAAAWRSPSLRCVSPPRSTGAARRTGGDAGRSSVRSARGS